MAWGLFPGTASQHGQSNKTVPPPPSVTSHRPWNINQVPIGYGFRPRLRGRLTLRGLALRRNPWTFGGSVSHTPYRYSCQHSRFRYLQRPSQATFAGLRNAPLPCQKPEHRSQKSERDRSSGFSTSHVIPATSSRWPDTHHAISATVPRQCNQDPDNNGPIPASRHSIQWPSSNTA